MRKRRVPNAFKPLYRSHASRNAAAALCKSSKITIKDRVGYYNAAKGVSWPFINKEKCEGGGSGREVVIYQSLVAEALGLITLPVP